MMFPSRLVSAGIGASIGASIGLLFVIAPAAAQSPGQRVMEQPGASPRQESPVRVQSTLSFFVAGPSGDSDEAARLRDRARRSVYEAAARECDLLREVLAKDCRLESVNTNISRLSYGPQQPEGFNVNGSMSYRITLK